jgi:hypothetical protein
MVPGFDVVNPGDAAGLLDAGKRALVEYMKLF